MTLDDVNKIGFSLESTPGTDPISSADTDPNDLWWHFGIRTTDNKDFHPVETQTWQPTYKASSKVPQDSELIRSSVSSGVSFTPVNTIPYYLAMGLCTTGAGVHAITPLATTALPSFTTRTESTGGSDDTFLSATGCKAFELVSNLDLTTGWPYLGQSLLFNAFKTDTPTLNSAHDGLKYPTDDYAMSGTEVKTRFSRNDGTFVFTWDGDDYKTDLLAINWKVGVGHNLGWIDGQAELEYIDESLFKFPFNVLIARGNDSSFYDDFLAEANTKTMVMKIYAGATNYQQITWSNCVFEKCAKNYPILGSELPTWSVGGWARSVAISSKDGVAIQSYGETP